MNEESAFVSAILAAPGDDTSRLVYADWLDERDDPRGPFLRAAVALKSLDATDEKVPALRQQILDLRPKVPAAWLVRVLRGYAEDDVREAVFRNVFGDGRYTGRPLLFVEGGNDPSWYLFARLVVDYPTVRLGSKVVTSEGETFPDYLPGGRYAIEGLTWHDETHCDADYGVVFGPLAGHGGRYRVELRGEKWVVTGSEETWIS